MKYSTHYGSELEKTDTGRGVYRKVAAYCKELMMVEVHFEKDGVGSVHEHPHAQCTYVLKGSFMFDLDGDKREVRAGDSIAIYPNCSHGVTCLEEGILLDTFSPMRDDFLA